MKKYPPLFLILSTITTLAHAITDQERSTLQRLATELESLTPIIDQAQHALVKADRHQVHYQNIRSDINTIKHGIEAVVTSPRRDARTLPPIKGEYQ